MRFFRIFTKIISPALLLFVALSACGGGTTALPSPSSEETSTPEFSSSAQTEPVWTDQTFAKDFTAEDGTVVMSVSYAFPDIEEADQNPAWAELRAYYAAEGAAYMENAEELAGYAADGYDASQKLGTDFLPFGEESSYRFSYRTDTLVSVVRNYYANSVTGAAHPASFQFSEQFDLVTGKKLTLSDFFTDPDAARSRILSTIEKTASPAGYTLETLSENFKDDYFYLTDEGFVFYYQPDTVAPYAAGLLEFPVPYSVLEDLMSENVS